MNNSPSINKGRLYLGAAILAIGFMSPLLIPLVTSTNWSIGLKGSLSGLLAFGIPEVFMLIAIAVMGKQGYEFLKSNIFKYLKRLAPPDYVSLARYRIGLIMFISPLLLAWVQPYLNHIIPFVEETPLWFYILGDLIFLLSFFVLGGDFWDKLSSLFKHQAKVISPATLVKQNVSEVK